MATHRGDHRDLPANQIGCQLHQSIVLSVRPPIFDHQVLAFDEALFLETLSEGGHKMWNILRR